MFLLKLHEIKIINNVKHIKKAYFSERVKISFESTQFTYRSVLSISNLKKSDRGEYTCLGKSKDGREEINYYDLKLAGK